MHLLISLLAALLGSLLGSAARAGIGAAERQLKGEAQPENVVVTASPSAAVIGGMAGLVLGTRRAFWLGAVLSAAGADRIDRVALGRIGIDTDGLVAKAMDAAAHFRGGADAPVGETAQRADAEG